MSPKEFKKSNIRNTLHTSPGILLRHSVPVDNDDYNKSDDDENSDDDDCNNSDDGNDG
jgi:hypothetical protein